MDVELSVDLGAAPEDVLVLPDGAVLSGLEDGRVVRVAADFSEFEVLADTGGRPLGLEFYPQDRVLICDARKGLFLLDMDSGDLSPHGLDPPPFCNNAAVAGDGTIYFSSSSRRYPIEKSNRDVIEARPTGSLWRCAPDGHCVQLAEGLFFANGVVLSPDESFVLVAETGAARVQRYDLDSGQLRLFRDLQGLPDNLSVAPDGRIWAALVAPVGLARKVWALPAPVRWLVARLPEPSAGRLLQLTSFGFDGAPGAEVDLADAAYHYVTGVREANGWLHVASIGERCIARLPVPVA